MFGIKEFNTDKPYIISLDNSKIKLRKYKNKCDSVKDYMHMLNTSKLYHHFRFEIITQDLSNNQDLNKLIKQGKIRHIGLSNETAWGLTKFLEISKIKNLPRIASIQNPYNLLNRTHEVGLAEISVREKSGLLAYSPLASGYLSGKYRNGQMPKNSRMDLFFEFWPRYRTPNAEKVIDEYFKISEKYNLNLAQMSLKFCEIQPFMTSVIIGATTMEQLKINIESVNVNLNEEIIKDINNIQKLYTNPCP